MQDTGWGLEGIQKQLKLVSGPQSPAKKHQTDQNSFTGDKLLNTELWKKNTYRKEVYTKSILKLLKITEIVILKI